MILRKGMWVTYTNNNAKHTGIVTDFNWEAVAVDQVDDKGLTVGSLRLPASAIEQAKRVEIPEPRRPSAEAGARLGYV
jgi:hypothetical protein